MEDFNDSNTAKIDTNFQRKHYAEDSEESKLGQREEVKETSLIEMRRNRKKPTVGRWTQEEHDNFVKLLKRHGKNWDKIEEKISTRTGVQVRSHAQKFFTRIRKEFNTNDPMRYIINGMCDKSKVYKFNSKGVNQLITKEVLNYLEQKSELPQPTPAQNKRYNFQQTHLYSDELNLRNCELRSTDSMKNAKQDSDEGNLNGSPPQDNSSSQQENNFMVGSCNRVGVPESEVDLKGGGLEGNGGMRGGKDKGKHRKMFKITKTKKDSSQESFMGRRSVTPVRESQSNERFSGGIPTKNKLKEISSSDSNNSTQVSTNYICLDKGKITIRGNEIETVVPCDIETINNKISLILPHGPVRIEIRPLALNQPQVFDPKRRSFVMKDSSRSNSQSNAQEKQYLQNLGLNLPANPSDYYHPSTPPLSTCLK